MSRSRPAPARTSATTVRCAIYTRKSTEEGLEQEFNSLDAQRESGELYVSSQRSEGWVCLPDRYDDGGYTGGNMERPALTRLLDDIRAGKIDCVVVYKVDRLSRSLLDFARMMEAFERHKVSFVSVTQQFNTASSMGRLVLNVLLSFAQFERELVSELLTGRERGPVLVYGPAGFRRPGGVAETSEIPGSNAGWGWSPRSPFALARSGFDENPGRSRRPLDQTSQTL